MTYFFCVISQKPFLEMELERFQEIHSHGETVIKPAFYFAYDCRDELLCMKKPTAQDPYLKIILGRGYLAKNTGYAQAEYGDWERLLKKDYQSSDIDGHYIALRVSEDFLQATSDSYGHYQVYYATVDDYFVISNRQDFIAQLIDEKSWNDSSVAALALLPSPLGKSPLLNNISQLPSGATLTFKNNKFTVHQKAVGSLSILNSQHTTLNTEQYFFHLKKAFELQLKPDDFMSLPFEEGYASTFAFSIWCHKAKKYWGLYHLYDTKTIPEDYLDPYIIANLKIFSIPAFAGAEVFPLYTDYVLTTGLSDFPETFSLAGNFKKVKNIHEINLIASQADWLFERNPFTRVEKLFSIYEANSYSDFKKTYVAPNEYFEKDFYQFLLKGIELHFGEFTDSRNQISNIYDFYINAYQKINLASPLAWLNNFRTFYTPGMFHSLASMYIAQRLKDPNIGLISSDLHKTFAEESLDYPKITDHKWIVPHPPNLNHILYPQIADKVREMIEEVTNIPYYDHSKLLKINKRAQNKDINAITSILKWTTFELWRRYIE